MTCQSDIDTARRTLVREFKAGRDVGAFLVEAACAAQRQLTAEGTYAVLTDNRSGSWEASLLEQMLESGGAFLAGS